MKLVGSALEESVHSYTLCIPKLQVESVETPQKGRPYRFFGNPRRVVRFFGRERMTKLYLCNGFFKTYALIPCLFLRNLGLRMKFIPFLSFYLNHKQFVAATNITRRNTMHKYTRSILGNPSQQGKKTQPIFFYILQEKYLHHHKELEQKRVIHKPYKTSSQERCALFPRTSVC
jgi:hypothetical protein